MGWPVCNSTLENESISETPLWTDGLTYHKLSVLIGLALGIFSVVVSGGLIMLHATHYSKPTEQRYIIRILFMVPIYSLVAFLSLYYYRDAVYYEVLGDCYEAFAISAFFTLLCQYIAPDLHSQKEYFRGIKPKQWVWPIPWLQRCWGGENGIWRIPRSGLTWFNVIWAGVFQYCFLRVLMTIVAVVTQAFNVYCEESLNPAFSHIWVLCIESVCVTIAMYCLIQFYIQVMNDIAQYEPLLKIVSIKLVIFLSFWQSTVISFLVSAGAVKASKTIQMQDLKVGIPNLLIAIEMAIFAVLHWWAFPWRPYVSGHPNGSEVTDLYGNGHVVYQGGLFGMKALVDASNPWDLFKATGRGFRWLFVGRKRRTMDPSYQNQSDSISLKPAESASETNLANSGVTAYGGAGMSAAQRSRYGTSPPNEEGEVLLAHAQPNPTSYSIQSTGDLGMVPQSYDSDRFYSNSFGNDSGMLGPGSHSSHPYSPYQDTFHSPSPSPYLPPADDPYHHHPYSQEQIPEQEIGIATTTPTITTTTTTTTAYPRDTLLQEHQLHIPMPLAYIPPPSTSPSSPDDHSPSSDERR